MSTRTRRFVPLDTARLVEVLPRALALVVEARGLADVARSMNMCDLRDDDEEAWEAWFESSGAALLCDLLAEIEDAATDTCRCHARRLPKPLGPITDRVADTVARLAGAPS